MLGKFQLMRFCIFFLIFPRESALSFRAIVSRGNELNIVDWALKLQPNQLNKTPTQPTEHSL